jgi:Major Facilitator Superfamily
LLTVVQEGLLTVVVSIAAYFFIHNYPSTARFLSDSERELIQRRLKADSDATRNEAFTWANVSKAFFDIKVYLYCFGFHTLSLPLYTLSLFLPSIIKALGYTAAQAQLLTVPPYAIAFIVTIAFAVVSEKFGQRGPFIAAGSATAIIGYIILFTDHGPGVSYLGTIFAAAGIYPAVALTLAWPANNVSGQTKRAVAGAMQISIGNLGAVLGTQLYRTETAPRYYLGHGFALGYLVANIIVTATTWWLLKRENARRNKGHGSEKLQDINETEEWLGDDDPRWRFYQ